MIQECEYIDDLKSCIDSLAFVHAQQFGASSVIPRPGAFARPAGKKTRCGVCGIVSRAFYDHKVRRIRGLSGLNNKICVIQRRAYGFRDEEYLRLKILTCMLPEI